MVNFKESGPASTAQVHKRVITKLPLLTPSPLIRGCCIDHRAAVLMPSFTTVSVYAIFTWRQNC